MIRVLLFHSAFSCFIQACHVLCKQQSQLASNKDTSFCKVDYATLALFL